MITTKDIVIVRGQTWKATFTTKDENGARVDISGSECHLRIRPDIKAAPVISKSTSGGISISAQTGSTKGQFVATIIPGDTSDLPTGDYVWDAWIVLPGGDTWPLVAPSRFTIIPEVTTL